MITTPKVATPELETPHLPPGWFFRVKGPAKDSWGDERNDLVTVQLRVRGWFGLSVSVYDERSLAYADSIHYAMKRLKDKLKAEEESDKKMKSIRRLYGDYPPKKLKS